MMKLSIWEKQGDFKNLFPDYSKSEDISLVLKTIEDILKKRLVLDSAKVEKLKKWKPILRALKPDDPRNNCNLIVEKKNWMDNAFLEDVKEKFLEETDFIMFQKFNDGLRSFALSSQPFDEAPLTKEKSGAISCHGIFSLLKECKPIALKSDDHYFVGEIKGMQ